MQSVFEDESEMLFAYQKLQQGRQIMWTEAQEDARLAVVVGDCDAPEEDD